MTVKGNKKRLSDSGLTNTTPIKTNFSTPQPQKKMSGATPNKVTAKQTPKKGNTPNRQLTPKNTIAPKTPGSNKQTAKNTPNKVTAKQTPKKGSTPNGQLTPKKTPDSNKQTPKTTPNKVTTKQTSKKESTPNGQLTPKNTIAPNTPGSNKQTPKNWTPKGVKAASQKRKGTPYPQKKAVEGDDEEEADDEVILNVPSSSKLSAGILDEDEKLQEKIQLRSKMDGNKRGREEENESKSPASKKVKREVKIEKEETKPMSEKSTAQQSKKRKRKTTVEKTEPTSKKGKPDATSLTSGIETADQKRKEEHDKKVLFVNNLPSNVKLDQVKGLSKDIMNVRIRIGFSSQKHLDKRNKHAYAYLTFGSESKATANYKKLQGVTMGENELIVDYVGSKSSHKKPMSEKKTDLDFQRLYVAGLSENTKSDDLRKLFPTASEITIPMSKKHKRTFGYAFLGFKSKVDCMKAHDTMQNKSLVVLFAYKLDATKKKEKRKETKKEKPAKQAQEKKLAQPAKKRKREESEDDDDEDEDSDDVDDMFETADDGSDDDEEDDDGSDDDGSDDEDDDDDSDGEEADDDSGDEEADDDDD